MLIFFMFCFFLEMLCFYIKHDATLKLVLGGVGVVATSIKSVICLICRFSVFLREPFFQNIFGLRYMQND